MLSLGMSAYLMDHVIEATMHEQRSVKLIAEDDFNVIFLSAFFQLFRYDAVRLLSYERMMM